LVWQFGLGHRRKYAWCDIALHEKNDKGVPFPCLFQNEVMIVNNESWIFIRAYVIENWQDILISLNLKRVTKGVTTKNIYSGC
jgi:hypothetical protein